MGYLKLVAQNSATRIPVLTAAEYAANAKIAISMMLSSA